MNIEKEIEILNMEKNKISLEFKNRMDIFYIQKKWKEIENEKEKELFRIKYSREIESERRNLQQMENYYRFKEEIREDEDKKKYEEEYRKKEEELMNEYNKTFKNFEEWEKHVHEEFNEKNKKIFLENEDIMIKFKEELKHLENKTIEFETEKKIQ